MKKLFVITGEYSGDRHAADVVREIKKIPSTPDVVIEKTIFIYRLGILVGGAIFRNDEPITWVGTASEIWGLPVERCELIKHSDTDYVFKIYIKEPYEGAYVAISPILPSLIANAYATVPQGVYTRS